MTNVELHPWLSANIPELYTKRLIKKEIYRRILKAFTTSWDCRYGFYLDDGRIYIYRSGFLLCRFRLNIGEPIADFQIATDTQQNAAIIAFENAMESVEQSWNFVADSDEERPANLKCCKYYQGETELSQTIPKYDCSEVLAWRDDVYRTSARFESLETNCHAYEGKFE